MPNVSDYVRQSMTRRAGAAVKMRYSVSSGPLIANTTPERPSGRSDALLASTAHSSLSAVGDLPQSHVSIATQFEQTACADISKAALDISEKKLPKARKILRIDLRPPRGNEFAVRLHSRCPRHLSYGRRDAEKAVREMVRLVKPGGRIVIYSNPKSPIEFAAGALHRLRKMFTPKRAVEESGLLFSSSARVVATF